MRISRTIWVFVLGAMLSSACMTFCASAAAITGNVYTNLCNSTIVSTSLGSVSGSCSAGNSQITVSGDAEGSGLTFGDYISATDSNADPNETMDLNNGYYGYARTVYDDEITLSTSGTISLTFFVDGTTS